MILCLYIVEMKTSNFILLDEPVQPAQNGVEGRIVGGETSKPLSRPWHVRVYQYYGPHGTYYLQCSAALIQPDLIITSAAGCLKHS